MDRRLCHDDSQAVALNAFCLSNPCRNPLFPTEAAFVQIPDDAERQTTLSRKEIYGKQFFHFDANRLDYTTWTKSDTSDVFPPESLDLHSTFQQQLSADDLFNSFLSCSASPALQKGRQSNESHELHASVQRSQAWPFTVLSRPDSTGTPHTDFEPLILSISIE